MNDDIQQVVIRSADNVVLRAGFCGFATDGSFDPAAETILVEGVDFQTRAIFDPPPPDVTWLWTGSGFVRG